MKDPIERQAAIDEAEEWIEIVYCERGGQRERDAIRHVIKGIKKLPSAQPEPSGITDEQAILHLQSTGWMQNHDREMYESGLRKQLADDSGSYDAIIPCADTISRQAAIRIASGYCHPANVAKELAKLPSVQPVDKDINVSCKDAISRQGAIDICNIVIDLWQGQLGEGALVAIKNAINNLPSVHPIIRCKDCRWWKDQSRSNAWLPCRALVTPDDFYCGRAERRTDGTD